MVQYEVIACSASVKGLLNKPRAPIIFCLLLSRSCNKEHNNDDLFARVLPRCVEKIHVFVFVCRCCLQPCRILDLPWQRIKNTEDDDCQHKEVHIDSSVKMKSMLLLSSVLLLKLHWASVCMNKAPNLMGLLIELFFVICLFQSSRDHAS